MKNQSPPSLKASELHELWVRLPDARRFGFLASLSDEAADSLLAYQLRLKETAARTKAKGRTHAPVTPNEHWTDEELAAFISQTDAEVAATATELPSSFQTIWEKE